MNRTLRHAVIASVSLAAAVTLAACSGTTTSSDSQNMPAMTGMQGTASTTTPTGTSSPADAATAHNAADVAFATTMIPHHQQAVTMAAMAGQQASNAQVKTLAGVIKAAQDPEIATMSRWLTTWGQPVPSTSGGHDMSTMGDTPMEGMMTEDEMAQLSAASGAGFDRLWLQMMIKHHQGAVAMATTETADGQNAEAKRLAQQIIGAQTQEIATMEKLLPTISG